MPVNGYNIGSDTTLNVIVEGQLLVSQILTSFEARQITTRLKSVGIDGKNRYADLEEGWEGELSYDRGDPALDEFFAAKEAGRYAGLRPPRIHITETTTNVDGSISKYRYEGVTMRLDTIGRRSGDAKVEERVSWACSRRIQVM